MAVAWGEAATEVDRRPHDTLRPQADRGELLSDRSQRGRPAQFVTGSLGEARQVLWRVDVDTVAAVVGVEPPGPMPIEVLLAGSARLAACSARKPGELLLAEDDWLDGSHQAAGRLRHVELPIVPAV